MGRLRRRKRRLFGESALLYEPLWVWVCPVGRGGKRKRARCRRRTSNISESVTAVTSDARRVTTRHVHERRFALIVCPRRLKYSARASACRVVVRSMGDKWESAHINRSIFNGIFIHFLSSRSILSFVVSVLPERGCDYQNAHCRLVLTSVSCWVTNVDFFIARRERRGTRNTRAEATHSVAMLHAAKLPQAHSS